MNSYGDSQSARTRAHAPGAAPDDPGSAGYPDEPRPAPDAYRRGAGRASLGGLAAGASVGAPRAGGRASVGSASVGVARPGGRASVGSASVGSASVGGRAAVARAAVRPGVGGAGRPP